jgi:hypothetical protein
MYDRDLQPDQEMHAKTLIEALQAYPHLRCASVCVLKPFKLGEPQSERPKYDYAVRVDPVKRTRVIDDIRYDDWRRARRDD